MLEYKGTILSANPVFDVVLHFMTPGKLVDAIKNAEAKEGEDSHPIRSDRSKHTGQLATRKVRKRKGRRRQDLPFRGRGTLGGCMQRQMRSRVLSVERKPGRVGFPVSKLKCSIGGGR